MIPNRHLLRLAGIILLGATLASNQATCADKPSGLTEGWTSVAFEHDIQKPYNLELKDRYQFDAANKTHRFWVNHSDKPHKPPPNPRRAPRCGWRAMTRRNTCSMPT